MSLYFLTNDDGSFCRNDGGLIVAVEKDSGNITYVEEQRVASTSTEKHAENDTQFIFDHNTILLLLDLVEERKDKLRSRLNKSNFWREIAEIFNQKGYFVTGPELDRKFRNLKSTYIKIKDHQGKSGRDLKKSWPYYDKFDSITVNDACVNATNLLNIVSTINTDDNMSCTEIESCSNEGDSPSLLSHLNVKKKTLSSSGKNEECAGDVDDLKNCHIKKKRRQLQPDSLEKMLNLQEKHIAQIKDLQKEIKESNAIQEKRNQLLEKLIEKKCE